MLGDVFHLDRVAQVWLVRTVFADRHIVRDTREFLSNLFAFGKFLKHAADNWLHRVPDFFLGHKAHFHVELVEFPRQTIGARVLITEARRDLEIAIEPGHHQQLLILLGRLRQREEFTRMDAAGYEKVASPFRRRGRQYGRGIFTEPDVGHATAHRRNDPGALDDVGVQRFTAQIDKTIPQPDILGIFRFAEHGQRQFCRLAQHFDIANENFDLACRQVLVGGFGRARLDLTIDPDNPFGPDAFYQLESGRIRIDHTLGQPVMVTQVDKQQSSMISNAMHPS